MSSPSADGPAPRVLLVDDDAETLILLRAALEDEGVVVVGTAGDGPEGETLAGETDPDVVLMDLRMPGMDGLAATRSIKASRPWIQVIILTFYQEMLPALGPYEVGAFAYLVKGCSTQLIHDVIMQAWKHAANRRRMSHSHSGDRSALPEGEFNSRLGRW